MARRDVVGVQVVGVRVRIRIGIGIGIGIRIRLGQSGMPFTGRSSA